jgi:hypothetical protein
VTIRERHEIERINAGWCGMTSREFSRAFERAAGSQWTETGVCIRVGTQRLKIKGVVWNAKEQQLEIVVK